MPQHKKIIIIALGKSKRLDKKALEKKKQKRQNAAWLWRCLLNIVDCLMSFYKINFLSFFPFTHTIL